MCLKKSQLMKIPCGRQNLRKRKGFGEKISHLAGTGNLQNICGYLKAVCRGASVLPSTLRIKSKLES